MSERYWVGDVPTHCQISGQRIRSRFVDGRIPGRTSWAIMCPTYFTVNGGSLGTGRGQMYEKQPDGKWKKVAG